MNVVLPKAFAMTGVGTSDLDHSSDCAETPVRFGLPQALFDYQLPETFGDEWRKLLGQQGWQHQYCCGPWYLFVGSCGQGIRLLLRVRGGRSRYHCDMKHSIP
jgi:hypothetical protein